MMRQSMKIYYMSWMVSITISYSLTTEFTFDRMEGIETKLLEYSEPSQIAMLLGRIR